MPTIVPILVHVSQILYNFAVGMFLISSFYKFTFIIFLKIHVILEASRLGLQQMRHINNSLRKGGGF